MKIGARQIGLLLAVFVAVLVVIGLALPVILTGAAALSTVGFGFWRREDGGRRVHAQEIGEFPDLCLHPMMPVKDKGAGSHPGQTSDASLSSLICRAGDDLATRNGFAEGPQP